MKEMIVFRKKIQEFYGNYSLYIDKIAQFLMAFIVFSQINKNIGMKEALTKPIINFGLSAICAFLPLASVALVAAGLIVAHVFVISKFIALVCAGIFLMMFIFYCRFTPKRAIILLLTPIAFALKLQFVVPIACGLLATPAAAIPVAFGTICFYMINYIKGSSAALTSVEGVTGQISLFVKSVFQNKEMWIYVIAFILCVIVVYWVRVMPIDHSWKIAIVLGAVANVLVIAVGDISFDITASYGKLIIGNLIALAVGLILEFLFLSVDYARSERLQFEDDDYYYFVKAIPKFDVAVPEKRVKRISSEEPERENESEHPRRREPQQRPAQHRRPTGSGGAERPRRRPETAQEVRRPKESTEEILLTKSLQEELNLADLDLMGEEDDI